jgi:MFS transporter, UMF1 family
LTERAAGADGFVHPLGIPIRADSLHPYVLVLSVALQVLVLPITGAIADRTQHKKRLLALLAYGGAVATMGLYLVQGSAYLLGGLLFVVANVAFGASTVVYNAFLPQIAEPSERDRGLYGRLFRSSKMMELKASPLGSTPTCSRT